MLQFLPIDEDDIFAVRATGKLTHEDYQRFLPELEARIPADSPVSLLIELDDFHGWTLEAMKDDFKLGMSGNFKRIALLGTKKWQRWMTAMAAPFVDANIRYFDNESAGEAWDWLRESAEIALDEAVDEPISPYSNIIVAVDFSPHSLAAVRRALELANLYLAQLTLIHVINEEYLYDVLYGPGDMMMAGYTSPQNASATEDVLRERAEANIEALRNTLEQPLVEAEIMVGTPSNTILSFAEAKKADLIVIGTHGRRGLARLLGSTAITVMTKSRCDVLSIPLSPSQEI